MQLLDIILLLIIAILGTAVGTLLVERFSSQSKSRETKRIYETTKKMLEFNKDFNQKSLLMETK